MPVLRKRRWEIARYTAPTRRQLRKCVSEVELFYFPSIHTFAADLFVKVICVIKYTPRLDQPEPALRLCRLYDREAAPKPKPESMSFG